MRSTPRTRMGTRLQDMSYADFHHEITRDPDEVIPKHPVGSQLLERDKEDELVRYMSNLPSYLEKGKDFQEKALNVGVLDWKILEKWRYNQNQTAQNHNGYSPSSSNNSSLFSTDAPSTRSSVGQSYSPVQQRTHHHLSLQAPQGALPKDESVQDAKTFSSKGHSCSPSRQGTHTALRQSHPLNEIDGLRGNSGKFQDSVFSMHNPLYGQQKVCGTLPLCKKNESVSKGQQPIVEKYEVVEPWKGKTKIEVCDSTKQTLKSNVTKMEAVDRDQREKSGVLIMPSSEASSAFKMNAKLSSKIEKKFCGRSSFESSLPSKVAANEHSDPTRASQYPENIKTSSHPSRISHYPNNSKMFGGPSRISAQDVKATSQPPPTLLPLSARMLSSPSRSRNAGEKKPFAGVRSANIGKLSEELDVRKSSCSVPRARNPSPIRRLGSAMGKMIKNTGSRDNSPVCRSSSRDCVAKSNSEGSSVSCSSRDKSCSNNNNNFNNNNSRGRSSPLRRLFEPLLKSRGSNSPEPSMKQSSVMAGATKSCDDQLNLFAGHSVKAKSRPSSDSHHVSKNGSLFLQALLQVSFKNGFPLFTFAIDNESDILAATVRKSFVPGKGHHYWAYTFFNVHEIKRKSGIWLNHVGKGNNHGYVPNVVAQMKVSDSLYPFNKNEVTNDHFTREFNLFAVDVGHGDQSATDFHPTNELAAIVTKLPIFSNEDNSKNGQYCYSWLDLSQSNLQANSDSQNQHSYGDVHVSTMVILPGGVHTVPSKGEMSTLAQRWRSGGCCDCGGWDLGCQLQVYTNLRDCERKIVSPSTCSSDNKFRLFSLVGQDKQLMMGLSPFKERIYSVEFNPSLSLLQAFAICISFLDGKRPVELSEASHIAEKINDELDVFNVPTPTKSSDHQVGAPTRYVVSYPPHSPVGRV